MPQLPKDESLSAQGPLQCTSALCYECLHSNGGATTFQSISSLNSTERFKCSLLALATEIPTFHCALLAKAKEPRMILHNSIKDREIYLPTVNEINHTSTTFIHEIHNT
jgi:hypothetical protein